MNFHGDISIQFLFFNGNPRLFFLFPKKEKIRKFNDNFAKRRKEIYKRNSVIVVSAMLMRDFILEE